MVLLVAWPAPLCCYAGRVECVRAVPDYSGRCGRLVLRLRGGVGKHRGVQTENEFRKEDQVCVRRRAKSACELCRSPVGLRYSFFGPEQCLGSHVCINACAHPCALSRTTTRCHTLQVMLNQYAGLNFRKKELLEKLKEKEEEAEGLRSAADEILMAGLDGPEEFQ